MQRKLLAIAVAGAFALPAVAFAQVTISGIARLTVDNTKITDGGTAGSGLSKWHGTSHSSNIKFLSRENLGSGLTAWGSIESGWGDARTSGQAALFNGRNSGAGLESTSAGTLMLGMWDSPYKQVDAVWNIGTPPGLNWGPGGSIVGSADTTGSLPVTNCQAADGAFAATAGTAVAIATACGNLPGSTTAFQRRLSNTIQWWSPVWSGAQFLVATQMNEEKANDVGTINKAAPGLWSYALRWNDKDAALVLAHERHKNFNYGTGTMTSSASGDASELRGSSDTGTKIAGSYNFGVVQGSLVLEYLSWDLGTVASPTNKKQRNVSFALAMPVGTSAIRAAASRSSNSGNSASITDSNASLFNLSYETNLSKRSVVYASLVKFTQATNSTRNFGGQYIGTNGVGGHLAGQDARIMSFGMNHSF